MELQNILLPILQYTDFAPQLDAAGQLSGHFHTHINALFIRPDAAKIVASVPDMLLAAGVIIDKIEGEGRVAEAAAMVRFDDWRAAHKFAAGIGDRPMKVPSAGWSERIGSVETVIADAGRLSDLIILARPDPDEASTQRAFESAVFATGRPALLAPPEIRDPLFAHIIIAWNSSIEATHAVAASMPFLRKAARVSIFTAPRNLDDLSPDLDLSEYLAWHGIEADYLRPAGNSETVGEALMKAVSAQNGSLLVMGAYTHSRLREMMLGGVTRHIIAKADIPVLMMH